MEPVMHSVNHSLAYACNEAEAVQHDTAVPTEMNPQEQYYTYMAEQYNNREGDLHEKDGYHCEKCKNRGTIAKAVYTEFGYWTHVYYDCECKIVRSNIARMRKSGLQDVIEKYRFDNYEAAEPWQQAVKNLAMDYTAAQRNQRGEGKWFFMGGASGAGKSHICTAICRELLLAGFGVQYMKWREDTVRLKAMVTDGQYEAEMHKLKTAEVLYIDDFFKTGHSENGMQKPSPADVSLAFELLNDRYNQPNAITIISSESMLDDIFAIDEAIGGRIWERADEYVVSLSGKEKNYRRKMRGIVA